MMTHMNSNYILPRFCGLCCCLLVSFAAKVDENGVLMVKFKGTNPYLESGFALNEHLSESLDFLSPKSTRSHNRFNPETGGFLYPLADPKRLAVSNSSQQCVPKLCHFFLLSDQLKPAIQCISFCMDSLSASISMITNVSSAGSTSPRLGDIYRDKGMESTLSALIQVIVDLKRSIHWHFEELTKNNSSSNSMSAYGESTIEASIEPAIRLLLLPQHKDIFFFLFSGAVIGHERSPTSTYPLHASSLSSPSSILCRFRLQLIHISRKWIETGDWRRGLKAMLLATTLLRGDQFLQKLDVSQEKLIMGRFWNDPTIARESFWSLVLKITEGHHDGEGIAAPGRSNEVRCTAAVAVAARDALNVLKKKGKFATEMLEIGSNIMPFLDASGSFIARNESVCDQKEHLLRWIGSSGFGMAVSETVFPRGPADLTRKVSMHRHHPLCCASPFFPAMLDTLQLLLKLEAWSGVKHMLNLCVAHAAYSTQFKWGGTNALWKGTDKYAGGYFSCMDRPLSEPQEMGDQVLAHKRLSLFIERLQFTLKDREKGTDSGAEKEDFIRWTERKLWPHFLSQRNNSVTSFVLLTDVPLLLDSWRHQSAVALSINGACGADMVTSWNETGIAGSARRHEVSLVREYPSDRAKGIPPQTQFWRSSAAIYVFICLSVMYLCISYHSEGIRRRWKRIGAVNRGQKRKV